MTTLTARQLFLLAALDGYGYATAKQLSLDTGGTVAATSSALNRLYARDLVDRLWSGPDMVWTLRSAGARAVAAAVDEVAS